MVRFREFCRPSRLLPTLALIAALTLAVSPVAWAAGPRLDPHGFRAVPSGDAGAMIDPNGFRPAPTGDSGASLDPNG
jgi:hypothetical protein